MRRGKNVLGTDLQDCSHDPLTGFYRDGCCRTGSQDQGLHTLCTRVTAEFLEFSKKAGNDLSTPNPMFDFAGLKPGDQWCVCVQRWKQAFEAGAASPVVLEATHFSVLDWVSLDELKTHAYSVD